MVSGLLRCTYVDKEGEYLIGCKEDGGRHRPDEKTIEIHKYMFQMTGDSLSI